MIPNFKTFIKESTWSRLKYMSEEEEEGENEDRSISGERSMSGERRETRNLSQAYKYWWRCIPIEIVPEYDETELKLNDFINDFIVCPLEKAMNIKKPEMIIISFWDEQGWSLFIDNNPSHGADNYTLEVNSSINHDNSVKYSEMSIEEKGWMRYLLKKKSKTLYVYPRETGISDPVYHLIDRPHFGGEKGVPLK